MSICDCRITLRKLCECSDAAEGEFVMCPMHKAAPRLLEALKKVAKTTEGYGAISGAGEVNTLAVDAILEAEA